MATIIRTSKGDILDALCFGVYGHTTKAVEAVFKENPGLSELSQPYAGGVLIIFPDLPQPTKEIIRLWD